MKLIFFLVVVLHIQIASTQHDRKSFSIGQIISFDSDVLSETRTLNVYLPENYYEDSSSYEVIYLLDGSENEDFLHVVGLVQFLCMYELLPNTIVVGIANVDRKRDFTYPTTIEQDKIDFPTTGGSAKFIDFLTHELIPFIENNFKVNKNKTIIGQSLGGLLATEILLKHPTLFNQYIIVSPSLWWDNESLLKMQSELFLSSFNHPLQIYIAVGDEGKIMRRDAKKLAKILKRSKSKSLLTQFHYFPKENHMTILHQAIYWALKSAKE